MTSYSNLAFDELPRGDGSTDATEQIARTLRDSGLDAPSGLFDEALALARDGHLSPAAERLRMLLCLDPTDAAASLLLGKILASRGQYQEALTNLDAAGIHGAVLPPDLRAQVEAGLRQQIAEAEDHRTRVAARERGEIQTLRSEAKSLRSENAGLELEVDDLQRRVRLWSSTTAVVAGVSLALVLGFAFLGGGNSADSADSTADSTADASPAATPAPAEILLTPSARTVAATTSVAASVPTTTASTPTASTAVAAVAPTQGTNSRATNSRATNNTATARTHVVKSGDTLGSLARRYYGSSVKWPAIQKANSKLLGGSIDLQIGMKLSIPAAP